MNASTCIEEFRAVLKRCTREAKCGQHFVLVDKLQQWLRSLVKPGVTNAARLLHVAFSSREAPGLPITPEYFQPGDNCCLLIFCILLEIGCTQALEAFSRRGKIDRLIPLRRTTVQDTFQAAGINDKDVQCKFFELQYRFRPAKFDLYLGAEWEENVVIPICEKVPINAKGGTADLWQIAVPEEFVGQRLRNISSGSRFNINKDTEKEPEWQYQFALKSFHGQRHNLFKNEMNALRGLKDHEGMVRWLADYKKIHPPSNEPEIPTGGSSQSTPNNTTYNILLEYGEMDLSGYFVEIEPPVQPSDIAAFWQSVFGVADAVKGIHNLRVHDAGITTEYYGWHTDIKPDNILYVEERLNVEGAANGYNQPKSANEEKAFKLADPGFAKFVRKPQHESQAIPKQVLEGGTETYGAPEYRGQSGLPVSQAIDIWSLGCVFSLAATWIVLGLRGVYQFQVMRQLAIEKLSQPQDATNTSEGQAMKPPQGDHFHNGDQVLNDVTIWHRHLRTVLRKSDSITSQVLDLVDEEMLLGPADSRITATKLCSMLDSILATQPDRITLKLPDTIKDSLGEFAFTRDLRQPSSFERPLRTTYRQPLRPDHSSRNQHKVWPEEDNFIRDPSLSPTATPQLTPGRTKSVQSHGRVLSESSIQTTPRSSRRRGAKKTHSPMNVFQAREELERRKSYKHSFSKIMHRSKPDEFQDGLLTSYFQGTRDIMFLVDNAESMKAHWYEATFLLRTLVEMAHGVDNDGMDLRFTTGTTTLEGKDSVDKFVNSMNKAHPIKGYRTDLRMSLGNILKAYADRLNIKAKFPTNKVKDLCLVVLTDGIWAGMQDKMAIAGQLRTISRQVDYEMTQRPFSVQFIQFGDDEAATQVLRHLDDGFDSEGKLDFIDTEHSKGDVNKMLLGSFVEEYDQDEGDDEDPFDSPSTAQQFNPPHAQRTFDDYVANTEARHGAFHANMDQIAQGIQLSAPPRPNHTQSFQVANR